MDFAAVIAQLQDVPPTFSRPAAPYTQLVDSLSSELTLFTGGGDALVQQGTFANALNGWLDCWGLMFDIARHANEGDLPYAIRISETLLAWVGTVPALQAWLNLFAPGGSIAENASGLGYSITLPATLTSAQITAFLSTLNRIRPAGVPFTVNAVAGGLYLGTINFFGEGRMQGAYLSSSTGAAPAGGPYTNNAVPSIPDLYFVDPTINA